MVTIGACASSLIPVDASAASSWLGWASSITTTATSHNKNKSTASGGSTAASGDKEELKPTINTNNDKEKQTNNSSGVTVEKTSDQDEDDDECWEDGGWGEEVRTNKSLCSFLSYKHVVFILYYYCRILWQQPWMMIRSLMMDGMMKNGPASRVMIINKMMTFHQPEAPPLGQA